MSAFSAKHYRILARAIAESREYAITETKRKRTQEYFDGAVKMSDAFVMRLVNLFKRDNPRFKRTTFITAATGTVKK